MIVPRCYEITSGLTLMSRKAVSSLTVGLLLVFFILFFNSLVIANPSPTPQGKANEYFREPIPPEWDWFPDLSLEDTAVSSQKSYAVQKLTEGTLPKQRVHGIEAEYVEAQLMGVENKSNTLVVSSLPVRQPIPQEWKWFPQPLTFTIQDGKVRIVTCAKAEAETETIVDKLPKSAVANAELRINQAYVKFRMNPNGCAVKDSFFEIKMDDSENPYLPLMVILQMLELKNNFEIDLDTGSISGVIPALGKNFELNMNTGEFSADSKRQFINKCAYHTSDNDLYLRYDVLSNWLPVKTMWNVESYLLTMTPEFKLASQIAHRREQQRSLLLHQHKSKNIRFPEPSIWKPGIIQYMAELRTKNAEVTKNSYSLNYFGSMLKGDAIISTNIDPDNGRWNVNHKKIQYKDCGQFEEMVIGDTYVRYPEMLGKSQAISGVSFYTSDDEAYGDSEIVGRVPAGSDVELYVGGVLIGYQLSEDGNYRFIDIPLVHTRTFCKVVVYTPDGVTYEERKVLAAKRNQSSCCEFVYRGSWGENNNNKIVGHTELFYGLGKGLTLGGGLSRTNFKDCSDKTYVTGSVLYSPIPNLSLSMDAYRDADMGYMGQRFSALAQSSHRQIEADLFRFGELTPQARNFRYSNDKSSMLLLSRRGRLRVREYTPTGSINLLYEIFDYEGSYAHEFKVGTTRTIDRRRLLTFNNSIRRDINSRQTGFFTTKIRDSVHKKVDFNISSDIKYDKQGIDNYLISAGLSSRRRMIQELDYGLDLAYNNNLKSFTPIARVKYRFQNGLTISARASKDDFYFDMSLTGFHSVVPPFSSLKIDNRRADASFYSGWVEGKIYLDENGNGEFDEGDQPMPEVELRVGPISVVTDSNGKYKVDGLSPYRALKIAVNSKKIDALFIPPDDLPVVKLSPGRGVKVDIPFSPVSGIHGYVSKNSDFFDKNGAGSAYIPMKVVLFDQNGREIESVSPEMDGFYILDGIRPGNYRLAVQLGDEVDAVCVPEFHEIKMPASAMPVYLSNIDFNIS